MDAAYITLKKIALFFSFALLCVGSWSSQANAQSLSTCGNVVLTSTNFQTVCTVSSTGANIPYTGTIAYSDAVTGWLSVSPLSSTATSGGIGVVIGLGSFAILDQNPGSHSATITLNPTIAVAPATISVTYNPGNGSGGSGGSISTSVSALVFCPNTSQCAALQTVTLTTSSVAGIPFTITAPTWLTVSPTSGTVSSTSSVQLSVYVNNFSAATSGQSLIVNYNNTSTSVSISVTGGSSGGSGTISPSPTVINWSYTTNGQAPTQQSIFFSDSSGAVYWSASATSDANWLSVTYNGANYGTGTGFIAFNGNYSVFIGAAPVASILPTLSSGTHTGTVTITDSSGNSATVAVILTVNGGGTGGGTLTVTPSSITLPSVSLGATSQVQNSATVVSSVAGTLSPSLSGTCTGISTGFSSNSLTAGVGVTLTVFGNPSGLSNSAVTLNCYVTLNLSNSTTVLASTVVPVTWVIGGGGSGGNGGSSSVVLPTALSFASQNGGTNSLVSQAVTINASGAWTAQVTSSPTSWLSAATSGTGPGTTQVSVNPTGLTAGTYNGSITYSTPSGTQQVSVTLLITPSTPVIYATPTASFSLQDNSGTISGTTQFQILASDGSKIPFTAATTTSWLVLSSPASDTTPTFGSFSINPAALSNGVYFGSITISAGTAGNPTLSIPVVLTVNGSSSGGGNLTFSTSQLTFNAQVNGSIPAAQTLNVSSPTGTSYSVSASGTNNNITWLSIQPSGFVTNSFQSIVVNVNQAGLPIGTYTGYLYFSPTSGGSQSVTVTLNVSTNGSSSISSSPTSLSFTANQGGAVPASQTLSITSSNGSATAISVTTTEQNGTGSTWLSASASVLTTPSTVTVSVNQASLSSGTYNGTVVITPTGGTPLSVPVSLTVSGLPTVSAAPTTLSMAYSVGGTSPTASISVTGGTSLSFTATASSTCNCIAVAPASGDTTSTPTLTVSITNPTTLTAGTYTGTITVNGVSNATGSTTVNVTLTVAAPLPTISAVGNAASGFSGAVSPGEIVSIFAPATNPIGPAVGVGLTSANLVNGNVPTTGLGGVKVTFNGYPAPVLYASASQVNAIVPYEVAGFSGFPVVLTYLGQSSNGFTMQTTATVPGIFTQNAAGSGPADVLNSDGVTVNGPAHPAPKGSTVSVYMTGEGATTPKGVDGLVTCNPSCSSISQIPIPLLAVAVLVDGQPAAVTFYGGAPGLVAGVMQVNFTIPTAARSGTVPLVVSVGGTQSQQNVTIAVQ